MEKTESKLYNAGVEVLRTAFGGTDVLILSDIYRLKPDEHHKGGKVGADLWIEGNKIFVGFSEMEDILTYGIHLAEEIVGSVLIKQK